MVIKANIRKATILSKATEYIAHLEKRNSYLTRENAGLKARVDAFEILIMARPPQQQQSGYQQQRQDYQQGYEAGQRAFRQGGGGSNVGLGQSPGWVPWVLLAWKEAIHTVPLKYRWEKKRREGRPFVLRGAWSIFWNWRFWMEEMGIEDTTESFFERIRTEKKVFIFMFVGIR